MKYISILLVLALGACAHKTSNNQTNVKLFVFDCGQNEVSDISIFSPGVDKGKTKTLVARCYLVKHPKGTLMWDTGLNDGLVKMKNGLKVMGGAFTLKVKKPLHKQLEEIGVSPREIDYLAFSHMHSDHTGNANLFTESKILMQEEEFKAAFSKDPSKYNFDKITYKSLSKGKVIKLNGDHDVFGDGSVMVLKTPGHTPGHQALFVDLPNTGPVVLSGDLYHFTKNRTFKRVPSFNFDKAMTLKSMDKLESFLKKRDATLWIQHDLEQNEDIALSPFAHE